jgi:putative flippase GtrA
MIRRIQTIWRALWSVRLFRFLVVGGINTLFGYGVYALLIFLHCNYKIAALAGTVLGILFNFMTTGRIVFENRNNLLLLQFIGVYSVTYLLNIGLIKILLECGLNALVGGAVGLLPMAVIAFVLNRLFVFRKETRS